MRFMHAGGVFALLAGLAAAGPLWVSAQSPVAIFTAAQAESGRTAYQTHCASCHAGDLGGRDDAPALKGDAFLATWQAKPAKELFEFVSATMPPEGGDISADDYLAIVAFALQQNGGAPGAAPLTATTATPIRDAVTRPQPQRRN
jgi:mono/diheme cytochrome c family protein